MTCYRLSTEQIFGLTAAVLILMRFERRMLGRVSSLTAHVATSVMRGLEVCYPAALPGQMFGQGHADRFVMNMCGAERLPVLANGGEPRLLEDGRYVLGVHSYIIMEAYRLAGHELQMGNVEHDGENNVNEMLNEMRARHAEIMRRRELVVRAHNEYYLRMTWPVDEGDEPVPGDVVLPDDIAGNLEHIRHMLEGHHQAEYYARVVTPLVVTTPLSQLAMNMGRISWRNSIGWAEHEMKSFAYVLGVHCPAPVVEELEAEMCAVMESVPVVYRDVLDIGLNADALPAAEPIVHAAEAAAVAAVAVASPRSLSPVSEAGGNDE